MAQIAMALLSCIIYVYLSYGPPLHIVKAFWVTVIVMTAFFILEMLLTWFVSGTGYFILDPFTYLDLATLVPFVVGMYAPDFYDVVSILFACTSHQNPKVFKSSAYEAHDQRAQASDQPVGDHLLRQFLGCCHHAGSRMSW